MGFSNIFLALVCLTTLALIPSSLAQNSPQDYLAVHNAARARVKVKAIRWDTKLATYAQNYANRIRKANTCNILLPSGGPYGEVLAASNKRTFTGRDAVNLWVSRRKNYNYRSNSCVGGQNCRVYTQVVWRSTVRVGCGRVRCSNGWWLVICSYAPPGNILGKRPY